MNIKEKIMLSSDPSRLTLFLEGMFYKCYNEDAMLFSEQVKKYKVSAKYIKSVGDTVYSLGFPMTEVTKGNLSFTEVSSQVNATQVQEEERFVFFLLADPELKNTYTDWRNQQTQPNRSQLHDPAVYYAQTPLSAVICERIKNFDLANRTPMESIIFVDMLKKEINTIEADYGII